MRLLIPIDWLIGEDKPFIRNIFTLNTCAHIVGSQVLSFEKEPAMLQAWRDFIEEVDPDVVIGYNIAGFDFPYLIDRAKAAGASKFNYLGRLRSTHDILTHLGCCADVIVQTSRLKSRTLTSLQERMVSETPRRHH